MNKKIEIASPRDHMRSAVYTGAAGFSAPDTNFYTSCYPSSSTAAYIPFGALSANIGGSNPFSYALIARMQSFGSWTWLPPGWVSGQQILTLSDGKNGGNIWIWGGPQGFSLSMGYINGAFQYTGLAKYHEWMRLLFTWDGETATAYFNGSALSAQLDKSVLSKPTFTIGLNATDPPAKPNQGVTSGPFIGDVQSFYVWNVCLSAAEVQEQMWAAAETPYRPDNLLLGYDFTANPPKKIGSGPAASPKNTLALGDASALASWGSGVATPGQATTINPGGSAPFSVLAWIFVGNDAQGPANLNGYIFSNGAVDALNHTGLKLVDGALVGEIGSAKISSSTKLSGYQWYYVAFTYDGTNGSLYVNSASVASGALSGASPTTGAAILFGGLNSNGAATECFQGYIQFLSVWKTCLTATEVGQQADEDPTLDSNCVANFMCSSEPCLDSIAVKKAVLWGTDQLQFGSGVFFGTTFLNNSSGAERIQGPKHKHRTAGQTDVSIVSFKDTGPLHAAPVTPLSDRHRQLMVNEFKTAISSLTDAELAKRWIEEFSAELDRVFEQARTSPDSIDGPHVSYEKIDGQFGLFYHPDPTQKIDLGVRIDQECAAWWVAFILTTILGVLTIFGVNTPVDDLTRLVLRIVNDPVVIQTCTTVVGFTMTAATMLPFCKVLYDFGYLGQAFWLTASSIGWWGAGKLLVYFVGVMAPVPNPQQALFIANTVTLVAKLVVKLAHYQAACGSGDCAVPLPA